MQPNVKFRVDLPKTNLGLAKSHLQKAHGLAHKNAPDTFNNGQLEKGESKPPTKKPYGKGTTTLAPNPININAIIP